MNDQFVEIKLPHLEKRAVNRPVPSRIAHVVLRTNNITKLVEWYSSVFQCEVIFQNEHLAFLAYDDEHHRFAIGTPPTPLGNPDHSAAGIDHVAFTFSSIGGMLTNYGYLKGIGIEPYWCIDHGMTLSMYYKDPDGNQIELQTDRFPDTASAHDYFRSSAFAENPVGTVFDADKLLELYNAGVPEASLMRPTALG